MEPLLGVDMESFSCLNLEKNPLAAVCKAPVKDSFLETGFPDLAGLRLGVSYVDAGIPAGKVADLPLLGVTGRPVSICESDCD